MGKNGPQLFGGSLEETKNLSQTGRNRRPQKDRMPWANPSEFYRSPHFDALLMPAEANRGGLSVEVVKTELMSLRGGILNDTDCA